MCVSVLKGFLLRPCLLTLLSLLSYLGPLFALPCPASRSPLRPVRSSILIGGKRLCLGKEMARLEAKMVASLMLRNYRLEPLPNQPMGEFVNGPVIFHKGGLMCQAYPRDQ